MLFQAIKVICMKSTVNKCTQKAKGDCLSHHASLPRPHPPHHQTRLSPAHNTQQEQHINTLDVIMQKSWYADALVHATVQGLANKSASLNEI